MANTQTAVPLFVANAILTAAQQNISAGTGVPVFATTITRDAAFGGSNKALAEGQLAYIEASNIVQYYDGAAWATLGPSALSTATFNETQASGTTGGTFTSGAWQKRTLNTTILNDITSCTLTASVIALPAGTYMLNSSAVAYFVDAHKLRLQNTTDSSTTILGTSERAGNGVDVATRSFIQGVFTITATKNFEVQHYAKTTQATTGLGFATTIASISEIYTTIQIVKLA